MNVALVCIPPTWNVDRKYTIALVFELRQKVFIWGSKLTGERESENSIYNQMMAQSMLFKIILSILRRWISEIFGGHFYFDIVKLTQLKEVQIFSFKLFEYYQINRIVHHFEMSCCYQSISSIITRSNQNTDLILFQPIQYDMRNLRNCQTGNFHQSFRRKSILRHKSVIQKPVKFTRTKCNIFHVLQTNIFIITNELKQISRPLDVRQQSKI